MPTINKGGDVLARGGVRATWAPGSNVTRKQWDRIFKEEAPVKKAVYLFRCPVHGIFSTKIEFFLSGGYPQLNEYKTSECLIKGCDEIAVYSGFQPKDGETLDIQSLDGVGAFEKK